MISLGTVRWTSEAPNIQLTFAYEKQRSGADMQYRAQITVATVSGGSYFGYPIYLKLSIGGTQRVSTTLKDAYPSQWTSVITYTSPWYTISNKTTGTTKVSFNVYSGLGSSRTATYSYDMGVDPAASEISASNGTLGTSLALTLTRYNSNFTDTITYTCGTASGTVVSGSKQTSVSWTTSNGNTVALSSQNTTGTSVKVTFTVTSYSGSTKVGTSSATVTMAIPSSVKPSVALSITDAAGYQSTYGAYVQGYSKLKITATPTLAQGSPIKKYAITADGNSYSTTPVTTAALQGKGTLAVTAKVTDARSRSSDKVSQNITVLEYAKPVVTLSAYRCTSNGTRDSEGAYMKIVVTSTISSLNGKNSATYKVEHPGGTITGSGTSYTSSPLACDVTLTHTIKATITDKLSSTTATKKISIAYTLLDYYETGRGIAFGKVGTRNGFDCSMDTYFNGRRVQEVGLAVEDTDAVNINYLKNVGLGHARWVDWVNVDTTMTPGWYRSTPSSTVSFGGIQWSDNVWFRVDAYSENAASQTFYLASLKGYIVRRVHTSNTWTEFECWNPPMELGVQYRTTGRYLGKPVYIKLVDFGALPNAANKNVAYYSAGSTGVVDLRVMLSDGCMLSAGYGRDRSHDTSKGMYIDCTKYNVRIMTESDFSSMTAYALVQYTID